MTDTMILHSDGVTYTVNETITFAVNRWDPGDPWDDGAPLKKSLKNFLVTKERFLLLTVAKWLSHPLIGEMYRKKDNIVTSSEFNTLVYYFIYQGWLIPAEFDETELWD